MITIRISSVHFELQWKLVSLVKNFIQISNKWFLCFEIFTAFL